MKRRIAGFTLLETLVALAILAIALSAAFRAMGVATSQAGEVRTRLVAEWIAQDRLAEHRARNDWLPAGITEGTVEQASEKFDYKEEIKNTPNALFRRIDVTVYRPNTKEQLAVMTGYLTRGSY